MKNEINNAQDIIDSRDIIERIEELENDEDLDELDKDELKMLKDLAKEGEDYSSDWKYGETLIRDTYFVEYAMDLAEDTGAIDPKANWPTNCIDWEKAARELQMDYSIIDFDGVDYWIHSC